MRSRAARPSIRVDRTRRPATVVADGWSPLRSSRTEPGLQADPLPTTLSGAAEPPIVVMYAQGASRPTVRALRPGGSRAPCTHCCPVRRLDQWAGAGGPGHGAGRIGRAEGGVDQDRQQRRSTSGRPRPRRRPAGRSTIARSPSSSCFGDLKGYQPDRRRATPTAAVAPRSGYSQSLTPPTTTVRLGPAQVASAPAGKHQSVLGGQPFVWSAGSPDCEAAYAKALAGFAPTAEVTYQATDRCQRGIDRYLAAQARRSSGPSGPWPTRPHRLGGPQRSGRSAQRRPLSPRPRRRTSAGAERRGSRRSVAAASRSPLTPGGRSTFRAAGSACTSSTDTSSPEGSSDGPGHRRLDGRVLDGDVALERVLVVDLDDDGGEGLPHPAP